MMGTLAVLREGATPIVWFRAILMELGFAGLIEEIEKRFGKLVTSLVLGCLLLAIFLWALQLVGEALVEAERLLAAGGTWDAAKSLGIKIGILLAAGAVMFGFFHVRLDKVGRQHREAAEQMNSEIEEKFKHLAEEREEYARQVVAQGEEYRERREELEAERKKLTALMAEADRKIQSLQGNND
ncbi:MAG: hypothetical protein OXK81_14635 [Chloroflexota bacterium]|nr:hypothetical protein [Chloroflexota bacterium]